MYLIDDPVYHVSLSPLTSILTTITMAHPHITNENDIDTEEVSPDREGFERKRLSRATGGEKLGCSLYILSPGVASWPYHYHTGNEEAIFVLGGRGTVTIAGVEEEIQEGDFITFPTGEEGAHRVYNSGDEELRYLCLSTMVEPDVAIYPDSNMIGVFAGVAPGGPPDERTFERFLRADAEVDYWDSVR